MCLSRIWIWTLISQDSLRYTLFWCANEEIMRYDVIIYAPHLYFHFWKIYRKQQFNEAGSNFFCPRFFNEIFYMNFYWYDYYFKIKKIRHLPHRLFRGSSQSLLIFNIGPYGILLEMYQFCIFFTFFQNFCPRDFFFCSTY